MEHGPEGRTPEGRTPADPLQEIVRRVDQITEENSRLFQELIAGERRYRRLAKAVWVVQEEERRRIARELHDGLGQNLTALKIQLEILTLEAQRTGSALGPKVAAVLSGATQILEEARELSHLLRPQILDDLGLEPALRWLGRTLSERAGLEVEVDTIGIEDRLEPELETVIFRVVQEALTNVVKHAKAPTVRVELERMGPWAVLSVTDRGCGFDVDQVFGREAVPKGSGLGNIRDRVELFGGKLNIRTASGRGTRIEVRLPVNSGEEESP